MGLKKCPICEVNYIKDDENCCDVCRRYKKGEPDPEADDIITMCIECGENPAVKGRELCSACLRESLRQEKLADGERSIGASSGGLPDVELLDVEVPIPADSDDIPASELEVIHKELGGDDDLSDEELEDGFDGEYDDELE